MKYKKYKLGEVVLTKHHGKCTITKVLKYNGYCVQSEMKKEGEYLNMSAWDFLEKTQSNIV